MIMRGLYTDRYRTRMEPHFLVNKQLPPPHCLLITQSLPFTLAPYPTYHPPPNIPSPHPMSLSSISSFDHHDTVLVFWFRQTTAFMFIIGSADQTGSCSLIIHTQSPRPLSITEPYTVIVHGYRYTYAVTECTVYITSISYSLTSRERAEYVPNLVECITVQSMSKPLTHNITVTLFIRFIIKVIHNMAWAILKVIKKKQQNMQLTYTVRLFLFEMLDNKLLIHPLINQDKREPFITYFTVALNTVTDLFDHHFVSYH